MNDLTRENEEAWLRLEAASGFERQRWSRWWMARRSGDPELDATLDDPAVAAALDAVERSINDVLTRHIAYLDQTQAEIERLRGERPREE